MFTYIVEKQGRHWSYQGPFKSRAAAETVWLTSGSQGFVVTVPYPVEPGPGDKIEPAH